jgi:cobalt-zinc-cadmium efflux system membrane fusion protein
MQTKPVVLTVLCLATLVQVGCGKGTAGDQPPAVSANTGTVSSAPAAASSAPSVKLTSGQLGAIKLAPAQVYKFPVEREAVGSVSFADDPAIIQAESTLVGAAASYDLTRKELARVKALGDANGIAQKELEQATSDEQTAAANLRAARDAVRVFGKSDAQINQMISTGQIERPPSERSATRWVVANALESDAPLFHAGQNAAISVLAFPDKVFDGVISEVYSIVDPNSHRVTLRIQADDPKNELKSGMLANVLIQIQQPASSVGVPEKGVVREGDGTMTVWVTTDRANFVQRMVKIGLRENGNVQILEGLQPNEQVVTDGAIFLDNILQAPPSD